MRISKICALVLALAMILPFAVACGNAQDGTPVSFSSVTIITTYDPAAEPVVEEEVTATGEAEPAEVEEPVEIEEPDYEETIYSGEVVVYVEDEAAEITVLDILNAYANDKNENLVINNNRVTKIGEISAGGGYFWNFLVNGADAGLGTAVTPEDEIQIIFTK